MISYPAAGEEKWESTASQAERTDGSPVEEEEK